NPWLASNSKSGLVRPSVSTNVAPESSASGTLEISAPSKNEGGETTGSVTLGSLPVGGVDSGSLEVDWSDPDGAGCVSVAPEVTSGRLSPFGAFVESSGSELAG